VGVSILLACEKHVHDHNHLISTEEMLGHLTTCSLTPPLFIEVPVSSHESLPSYICVLGGIDFASFYYFSIRF
jgi:hypothetical protein